MDAERNKRLARLSRKLRIANRNQVFRDADKLADTAKFRREVHNAENGVMVSESMAGLDSINYAMKQILQLK